MQIIYNRGKSTYMHIIFSIEKKKDKRKLEKTYTKLKIIGLKSE